MTNRVKITVSTPYSGNVNSMRLFGIEYRNVPGVGLVGSQEFDSMDDAKAYLCKRAELFADTEQQLNEYYEQIETSGTLTLDAASASIEEIED
jgi:hypothetical protein